MPNSADTERALHGGRRLIVRNALMGVLCLIAGDDNVSVFEDDPLKIGVCYPDGDFLTIQIDGGQA